MEDEPHDAAPPATSSAPAPTPATPAPDSDPDPIVATYTVYANPAPPSSRQLLVLQQPNRKLAREGQDDDGGGGLAISEVRVKPRTGMLEVDVPVSHAHADYDREKGQRWGAALQRSVAAKNGGSHGLAGGFGVGVSSSGGRGGGASGSGGGGGRGGRRGVNGEDLDMDLDWGEAVRQDKVLRTQTLGGQYPLEESSNCRWMIGVFQEDQLHLTPATSLIQLRPQLHHLDAYTEQERLSRPREAGGGPAASTSSTSAAKDGASATSGGGSAPSSGGGAPRAITMTIKSASTNEVAQETMTDRLRAVQTEAWSRLRYESDASDRAWDVFANHLIYKGVPASEDKGKGKGKAEVVGVAGAAGVGVGVGVGIDAAPHLRGRWSETEYLRAVSGHVDDGPVAGVGDGVQKDGGSKGKGKAAATTTTTTSAPAAATTPAATGARRTAGAAGGKGKSVAFKGTAMEID